MSVTTAPAATNSGTDRAAWYGLWVGIVLIVASVAVPLLTGWDVATRTDDLGPFPPLHGYWEPGLGVGTIPAVLLAVLAVSHGLRLAEVLSWRRLMLVAYLAGLAWLFSLALVDGPDGITRVLGNPVEYLTTAREVNGAVGPTLEGFIERIPKSAEDNWVIHIAGHPPGALLFFVGLVKLGLGGDLAAALVVVFIAATIPLAVASTLRTLAEGDESTARAVLPFLAFSPMAVFLAVSADAVFAAVAAWGLAALAIAAKSGAAGRAGARFAWASGAGLLLGYAVMMSYGLPLFGVICLAVLAAARDWWPLPIAAGAALLVVGAFALFGFNWFEAYPVLADRYWDGLAADRPFAYWGWGNIGAMLFSAGPLLAAAVAVALRSSWVAWRDGSLRRDRPVALFLSLSAALTLLIADLSRMSKSETERIWLPFMIWLAVSFALLPERWRKPGMALQVGFALVVQHLLYTSW